MMRRASHDGLALGLREVGKGRAIPTMGCPLCPIRLTISETVLSSSQPAALAPESSNSAGRRGLAGDGVDTAHRWSVRTGSLAAHDNLRMAEALGGGHAARSAKKGRRRRHAGPSAPGERRIISCARDRYPKGRDPASRLRDRRGSVSADFSARVEPDRRSRTRLFKFVLYE